MRKNYPIGIQDFKQLREKKCLYVDKTHHIEKLVQNTTSTYFLSRPRRFGKSLLISTLKYFFEGKKELFEGLYIYDKVNWEEHPVIHLDCSNETWKKIGLGAYFNQLLEETAEKYQYIFQKEGLANRFQELILSFPKKPVILIDEYDKPILHFLNEEDRPKAHENRKIMQEFYSILKPMGANIHFLLITGVTRFAKTSLFSDMNHLNDITINKNFATICGYTEKELRYYFKEDMLELASENHANAPVLWEELRKWYNGYKWYWTEESVYNPFSVLNFFFNNASDFQNYWFESGSARLLINVTNEQEDYNFDEIEVEQTLLNNFEIDYLNSITLLFQGGYLTIKAQYDDIFTLVYPNLEVKRSLLSSLVNNRSYDYESGIQIRKLKNHFEKRDENKIRQTFDALFAKIPHQIFEQKYEYYYHSILVIAMQLLGCSIETEVSVNNGDIDAVVKTKEYIYLIEFKVKKSAKQAIQQIKDKSYYQAYLTEGKKILLMGVLFEDKKVKDMKIEELKTN